MINARSHMLMLTYLALWVLAIASFTSTSLLALSHILIILPAFYFFFNTTDRSMSNSMWALSALVVIILLSVAVNPEMERAARNAFKAKYFIIGLLSIFAFREFFKRPGAVDKMKWPFGAMLFAVTLASACGMLAMKLGYNPLRSGKDLLTLERNSGLFGMLMTYAYGLSLYLVLLISFWWHRRDLLFKWVHPKFFYFCLIVNIVGLYLTYTRGAYLGLLLALPSLFIKKNLKLSVIALSGTLLIAALSFFTVPQVKDAFTRKGSDAKRIAFFQAAVMAGKERPLLGYGYRNFEPNVSSIKQRYNFAYPNMNGHAHNNILEHLASTGFLGAITFILFTLFWAWEMFRRDDIIGELGLASVVSFSISGLFQYTFGDAANVFFIMAVYSLSQVKVKDHSLL